MQDLTENMTVRLKKSTNSHQELEIWMNAMASLLMVYINISQQTFFPFYPRCHWGEISRDFIRKQINLNIGCLT